MRLAGGVAQPSVWRPTAAAVWAVGHIHSTVRQQEAFVAWQVAGVWAAGGLVRHALDVPTAAAVWPAGACTQCRSKLRRVKVHWWLVGPCKESVFYFVCACILQHIPQAGGGARSVM